MKPRSAHIAAALIALACPALVSQAAVFSDDPPEAPLRGPEVTSRPAGRGGSSFGEKAPAKGGNKPAPPVPMPAFLKALDAQKLSPEQDEQVRGLAAEFTRSRAVYLDEHKGEIDTLRAKLSPRDRRTLDAALAAGAMPKLSKYGFEGKRAVAGKAGKPDPMGDDKPAADSTSRGQSGPEGRAQAAAVRSRLFDLYTGGPSAEKARAGMLAVLRPEQRERLQESLAKLGDGSRKRGPAGRGRGLPADVTAEQLMNDPRTPERLRERLAGLPPERRDEFVRRLRERAPEGRPAGR
jgi:hypothetical protein